MKYFRIYFNSVCSCWFIQYLEAALPACIFIKIHVRNKMDPKYKVNDIFYIEQKWQTPSIRHLMLSPSFCRFYWINFHENWIKTGAERWNTTARYLQIRWWWYKNEERILTPIVILIVLFMSHILWKKNIFFKCIHR